MSKKQAWLSALFEKCFRQFGEAQLRDRGSFRSVRLVYWQYSVGFCASVGTTSLQRWTDPGRRSTSCPGSSGRLRHGRLRRQSSRTSAYDCTGNKMFRKLGHCTKRNDVLYSISQAAKQQAVYLGKSFNKGTSHPFRFSFMGSMTQV